MCKYCNANRSIEDNKILKNAEYEIFIVNGVIKILNYETGSSDRVEIKYCPICGDKLY